MNGTFVRRVMTGLPASSWLRSEPVFRSVKVLATTGNGSHRSYGRKFVFVPPTYNELPVPQGSWEKEYKKNNERYNKHLGMGITFFLFTIFVFTQVAEFNFYPPPLPSTLGGADDLCPPPQQEKKCT